MSLVLFPVPTFDIIIILGISWPGGTGGAHYPCFLGKKGQNPTRNFPLFVSHKYRAPPDFSTLHTVNFISLLNCFNLSLNGTT